MLYVDRPYRSFVYLSVRRYEVLLSEALESYYCDSFHIISPPNIIMEHCMGVPKARCTNKFLVLIHRLWYFLSFFSQTTLHCELLLFDPEIYELFLF